MDLRIHKRRRSSLFGVVDPSLRSLKDDKTKTSNDDQLQTPESFLKPDYPWGYLTQLKTQLNACPELFKEIKDQLNTTPLTLGSYDRKILTSEQREFLALMPDLDEYVKVANKFRNRIKIQNEIFS